MGKCSMQENAIISLHHNGLPTKTVEPNPKLLWRRTLVKTDVYYHLCLWKTLDKR